MGLSLTSTYCLGWTGSFNCYKSTWYRVEKIRFKSDIYGFIQIVFDPEEFYLNCVPTTWPAAIRKAFVSNIWRWTGILYICYVDIIKCLGQEPSEPASNIVFYHWLLAPHEIRDSRSESTQCPAQFSMKMLSAMIYASSPHLVSP